MKSALYVVFSIVLVTVEVCSLNKLGDNYDKKIGLLK